MPVNTGKRSLTRKQLLAKNNTDPKKLRGPRCQQFQKDATKRCKSRLNIVDGLVKKLKDLKTTTKDESLLLVYKDFKGDNESVRKFSTNLELLGVQNRQNASISLQIPTASTLAALSPTKRKNQSETRCPACGLRYGEERDDDFDSLWIECGMESCDIWQHVKCIGLAGITKTKLNSLKWMCPTHREKPPDRLGQQQTKEKK